MGPRSNRLASLFLYTSALLFVSGALGRTAPEQSETRADLQKEDDIRELIVSRLFAATGLRFDVLFIKVDQKDPTGQLLKRFYGHKPPVMGVSSARINRKFSGLESVQQRGTRRRGMIADIGKIQWLSADEAKVEGGYYCGGLCSASYTFIVKWKNEKWSIDSEKLNVIS